MSDPHDNLELLRTRLAAAHAEAQQLRRECAQMQADVASACKIAVLCQDRLHVLSENALRAGVPVRQVPPVPSTAIVDRYLDGFDQEATRETG